MMHYVMLSLDFTTTTLVSPIKISHTTSTSHDNVFVVFKVHNDTTTTLTLHIGEWRVDMKGTNMEVQS